MQAKHRKRATTSCEAPKLQSLSWQRQRNHACAHRLYMQCGASAIEFALVFPLFFLIVYALITYGMIFVAQQSVTQAAAEGARAALRYAADETAIHTNARNAAIGNSSAAAWLGQHLQFSSNPAEGAEKIPCPYATVTDSHCYTVTVSYPYAQHPLVPLLFGPLMSFAVPTQLSSTATVQLD